MRGKITPYRILNITLFQIWLADMRFIFDKTLIEPTAILVTIRFNIQKPLGKISSIPSCGAWVLAEIAFFFNFCNFLVFISLFFLQISELFYYILHLSLFYFSITPTSLI
ncbi:hypothetical protein BD408DRAFT_181539 [Parasitella parasitica]|nr:hypothetical protein BD408DRAFT_181539 [Parasitella parasitica]